MNFAVEGQNISLNEALLAHLELRLRLAMSQFGEKIRHAAVKLTGLNGRRRGFDKQCAVTAILEGSRTVIVKAVDSDFATAIDRAVERLVRSVRRMLERVSRTEKISKKQS